MDEVNNTIAELENSKMTFDTCQKLSSLYIIRDAQKTTVKDDVVKEYSDILPSYTKYCDVKRKYQLSEVSDTQVYHQLELLCSEISEFLQTLYHNTDTQHEHDIIESMLKNIV